MAVVPYTWAQVQGFHNTLMNCVRRSCGLSRHASTLFMMADRGDFGVGVDSAFHTYVYTLLQATEELLVDPGDRGSMARGLWRTRAHIQAGDTASVRPKALAQLPTLTARTQLAQLGITGGWSQEGPRGRKRRKMQTAWTDRVEAGNRSPDVVSGKLVADPAYMTPMWEAGLFEYEDFVTAVGDRILTFAELQHKHNSKRLDGKHRWALCRIASQLGCDSEGRLPVANRRPCRTGRLDELLSRFKVEGGWERDARDRTREAEDDEAWGGIDWGEDSQREGRGRFQEKGQEQEEETGSGAQGHQEPGREVRTRRTG